MKKITNYQKKYDEIKSDLFEWKSNPQLKLSIKKKITNLRI